MSTAPTILALDASSTSLGWCLYAGSVLAHGEHRLAGGDIATRCQTAYDILVLLLQRYPEVDVVAIESPASPHKKSLIPQARVSGALLLVAAQQRKLYIEITPQHGKQALAGTGNADKQTMQAKAAERGVRGEHASDALGIALAAYKRVEVVLV
jgi:Holliday junction resolvasome RuvABC endonuclease subunit